MIGAELAARRTSAGAVLGDFHRQADAYLAGDVDEAALPDWCGLAYRLATELRSILEQLAAGTALAGDGTARLSPADLATVLAALADAADTLERRAAEPCGDCAASPAEACEPHLDSLDTATAYRALARKLGDQP